MEVIMRSDYAKGKARPGRAGRTWISVLLLAAILILAFPQKAEAIYTTLDTYTVKVESGYLALRNGKAFKKENEIGKLYTGETVVACPTNGDESEYCYVYAPSLHKHGYVNASYLRYKGKYKGDTMYAKVKTGYLALRKGKAFKTENEIGKIYTGESVIVLDKSDSEYWTVYAPKLYKTGYVNCAYLYEEPTRTKVDQTHVPMGFTSATSNARWYWDSDSSDILYVRMQFTNTSSYETVEDFEVYVYAEDSMGRRLYGDTTVYTGTTCKTVRPGETVYCDYIGIPKRKQIKFLYAAVKRATLSDGTVCEHEFVDWDSFNYWIVE